MLKLLLFTGLFLFTGLIIDIIIYLYKIAILHHGMQSFHNNRLLHARLLHGCDVTHISSIGRFATSISLREHANERYAECLGMNWCSKHLIIINNPTQNDLFTEIDNFIEVYNNSVIELRVFLDLVLWSD